MDQLRVGINLGNTRLVTGRSSDGSPAGPATTFASRIAVELGVTPQWVEYPRPANVAEAAARDEWDICLIAADPAREKHIVFTQPWFLLEVCYAAPSTSSLTTNAQVDQPGVRIASAGGSAYTLWLERNLTQADLVLFDTPSDSETAVGDGKADVVAGLRDRLASVDMDLHPLAENVMTVDQAVGIRRAADADFIATITNIVANLVHG